MAQTHQQVLEEALYDPLVYAEYMDGQLVAEFNTKQREVSRRIQREKRKAFRGDKMRWLKEGFIHILEGMIAIFSFGMFSRRWRYEERFGTDEDQLASDWEQVGEDIRKATEQAEEETEGTNEK